MSNNNVEFYDFSVQVKTTLREKAVAFLEEVGGEVRSQAERNSRRDTGQTAGSYKYKVDEGNLAVHIGSDYWNAIYEEFGTGEHAINKNGRKGWWVYVNDGSKAQAPKKTGKVYTAHQAKWIAERLREQGLDAHYTKGKKANRPLYKSFTSMKSKIQKVADSYFGGI